MFNFVIFPTVPTLIEQNYGDICSISGRWYSENVKGTWLWFSREIKHCRHYSSVVINAMASQITGVLIVLPIPIWRSLKKTSNLRLIGLCEGIHGWPADSPHKRPVTSKMFPSTSSWDGSLNGWFYDLFTRPRFIGIITCLILWVQVGRCP